jgi:hypothetical protein
VASNGITPIPSFIEIRPAVLEFKQATDKRVGTTGHTRIQFVHTRQRRAHVAVQELPVSTAAFSLHGTNLFY